MKVIPPSSGSKPGIDPKPKTTGQKGNDLGSDLYMRHNLHRNDPSLNVACRCGQTGKLFANDWVMMCRCERWSHVACYEAVDVLKHVCAICWTQPEREKYQDRM
jgi:hypothetical protein